MRPIPCIHLLWTLIAVWVWAGCAPRIPAVQGEVLHGEAVISPTPVASSALETPVVVKGVTPSPAFSRGAGLINLPTTTATVAPPACLEKGGVMVLESIRSALLHLPMEVRVYLPPCYQEELERRYPVLYLLHGQNFTEEQWAELGVIETADRLTAAEEIPPLLIVMPRDRLWQDPPQTSFDEVFINELLPWVDATFRTRPERDYRAVGGLSRGGAWALHFGLQYPEWFGSVGVHSGFIFWSDTPFVRRWLDALAAANAPRLYLDIGHKDYLLEANQYLVELLDEYNIPHEYYQFRGYHDDEYWRANVERYLQWYSKGW